MLSPEYNMGRVASRWGRAMADASGTNDRGRTGGYAFQPAGYRVFVPTPSDARAITDLSYPAANDLVARLVSIGILERFGDRKRNRAFFYRDYVRVFADDPEPVPGEGPAA